ncbi:MAG: pirin family protein [Burkholderiales bacterium]|jgi:quercetin 2,3-dioxygenase|nr:pirin family protein [Burkholderiales bacterium]
MIALRPAGERGHADHGWLDSWHSFSFAGYRDPAHMGFGPLRVINEDRVAAGAGFGTHGHRDMEIISYVLDGALAHRDSLGNGSVIRPGDVQRMSAGTGVMHSEFNHQTDATTHFLQIWIEPDQPGVQPGYEERRFEAADKRGRLRMIASPDGADGSVRIHQQARVYAGLFEGEESDELTIAPGRRAYVHLARGRLSVNGQILRAGDAMKLTAEASVNVAKGEGAEVLVFDLP